MPALRRIADDVLYCHFVTFSVDRRRGLLDLDEPKKIILGILNSLLSKHKAKCVGFVIMPDHLHALIWLPQTGLLSKFIKEWKRQTSIRIRNWHKENAPNYHSTRGVNKRFWQPKYYSFSIDSQAKLEEKLNYIHQNPVKAKLAEKPTDWQWSSARWYDSNKSVGVPINWIEC